MGDEVLGVPVGLWIPLRSSWVSCETGNFIDLQQVL